MSVAAVVQKRVAAIETHMRVATTRAGEDIEMNLITRMRALLRKDSGQDLLEYALLVALVALVAVGAIELTGGSVNDIFTSISTELADAATP